MLVLPKWHRSFLSLQVLALPSPYDISRTQTQVGAPDLTLSTTCINYQTHARAQDHYESSSDLSSKYSPNQKLTNYMIFGEREAIYWAKWKLL